MSARIGPAVHLTDDPVGSPGWVEARVTRINGSEIAAVMGLSPYESPFSLWHRKAGNVPDVDSNDAMYWGTQLEPVIRDEWNRRHMLDGLHCSQTGQWCHRDRPWQGGSPDGLVYPLILESDDAGPEALLEVKTSRYGDGWGEPETDEIPIHYRCQVLWYLDVFELPVCHLAVLIAGSDYREYVVHHNLAELEPMRLKARAFLDTLETGQPPSIDEHTATYETVRQLHPEIDPESVEIPASIALPYMDALAACAAAEGEKRRTGAQLIDAMGNAQHATYLGDRIASRLPPKTEGRPPYLRAANGATKTRSAA